jgi:hypothetical protein
MVLAGETEVLGENLLDATLSSTNPNCQTRAAAVGSQRLTARDVRDIRVDMHYRRRHGHESTSCNYQGT